MTEKETKAQLVEKAKEIQEDIERLQKIVDASSETTFEIILEDLKSQMIENVNMESWSTLKSNIKEVDSIKGTQDFIAKQSTLLNKKKEELKEVNDKINNYQCGLFDDLLDKEVKAEPTGFKRNEQTICVGDIYKYQEDSQEVFYLIKKTTKGKFAFSSSIDPDGEMQLQYPANLQVLQDTVYVGNIHIEDCDHEKAVEAYNLIYQNIKKTADNNEDDKQDS